MAGQPVRTSRYFDFDGPVHYYDYGGDPEGPLLVCVHGLGGSAMTFDLIAPTLASGARVYAIDLIGHGRTPVLGRPATVGANRRLLDYFLTDVVGEPAILIGNSMGGLLSCLQAVKRPGSVAGIALISPALPLTTLVVRDLRTVLEFLVLVTPGVGSLVVDLWGRLASAELQVTRMIRLVARDPARVPAEARDLAIDLATERKRLGKSGRALAQAARSVVFLVQSPWYATQLDLIEAPVLLIHGSSDRLMSIRHANAAAQRHESWRFEVLNDVGHVPMIEEPEVTIAMIRHWLSEEAAAAVTEARRARTRDVVIDVRESRRSTP